MKCIIIEDQLPAQRILKKYIEDIGSLELIATYTNAMEAIQILNSETIDLMFLDIHLPKISGLEFLKTLSNPPQVILTTAFQEYALESYEFNVIDYLLKPFSFQRFVKAISKVRIQTENTLTQIKGQDAIKRMDEIYVKSGHDHIRISIDDIYYIMADSDYTELHLAEKKHLSSQSLRYWELQLRESKFIRIHKSYIVNTSKIIKVSGNQVFIESEKVVPIGRAYKSDFTERFIL
ncbi:LytR/AlgR family response regulator transcription factor [Psychroserpens sp. S379A]|uniref:LytR/AlgR family response regulator transcription factor n=1 Tax=Psychroserpens sp. S379A TaxID=3415137 RepID=UPI003C7C612B